MSVPAPTKPQAFLDLNAMRADGQLVKDAFLLLSSANQSDELVAFDRWEGNVLYVRNEYSRPGTKAASAIARPIDSLLGVKFVDSVKLVEIFHSSPFLRSLVVELLSRMP
jgi:hypothetical protein